MVWKMKFTWNIVHGCDLEDGTPTEWALKIAENVFYWITPQPITINFQNAAQYELF
jgi:hypothetical protein